MKPVICARCGESFLPRPKGYNAKYCSRSCKNRVAKKRSKYEPRQRRQQYQRLKADPVGMEGHRSRSRGYRTRVRQWLADYKQAAGCIDCGFDLHFSALQIDHTGEKSDSIANCRSSVARLKKEIDKGACVVRCANCHSIKTWCEKNGIEYVPDEWRRE